MDVIDEGPKVNCMYLLIDHWFKTNDHKSIICLSV